jgi:hypothetical protein
MRFSDVSNSTDFLKIRELAPAITPGVQPAPTVAPTPPQGQKPQAGMAGGQMDPVQAAQAAKERQEQKKQVQDQIKQTEQQLMDLRKKLAELG